MKYVYPVGCREISGFGGSYEKECRDMVVRGMEYFDLYPDEIDVFIRRIRSSYDLPVVCPGLEKYMCTSNELTGAMVGASLSHLRFAVKKGWDAYISELIRIKSEDPQD